jgi:hypothetical protein
MTDGQSQKGFIKVSFNGDLRLLCHGNHYNEETTFRIFFQKRIWDNQTRILRVIPFFIVTTGVPQK